MTEFVRIGQQLLQQIADATTLDDKRQLIAELERHLVGGVSGERED